MQNKKLVLIVSLLIVFVGVTGFIGGMFLSRGVDPLRLGAPFEGDFRSMIVPAPELPATLPEVMGPFVERHDNTLTIETKSLEADGPVSVDTKRLSGPKVEIVVNGATVIYRETTQPSEPLSVENQTIQQTVEQATLDDLNSQSMLMVWGRRSGDRIVAEVLLYSDIAAVKSAIFEDCEICP